MRAPSVITPSTGEGQLARFVEWYRSRDCLEPQALERVRELFGPVWPCDLGDADLRAFLSLLYLAVRFYRPQAVVQTGTFVGTSSVAIALAMRDNEEGELYTIDPEPPAYFGIDQPVAIARRVVDSAALTQHVRFVRGYSTVPLDRGRMRLPAAPPWQLLRVPCRGRYDMLVVDGDHTFRGCYLDLIHGAQGLRSRGPQMIVVHDYLGIPEVRRAVQRWAGKRKAGLPTVVPSPCGIALFQLPAVEVHSSEQLTRRGEM
jgi:predicted O-methyltransferase YrrM